LKLPEGVVIPALAVDTDGEDHDTAVANAIHIKADQGTGAAAAAEAAEAEVDELGEVETSEADEESEEGSKEDEG
jgi:hypothetical protein